MSENSFFEGGAAGKKEIGYDDRVEALSWIEKNKAQTPLAANRFPDKESALKFVKELYSLGSVEVVVTKIIPEEGITAENFKKLKEGEIKLSDLVTDEEGTMSDFLIVTLPEDLNKRKELFRLQNQEAGEDSGNEEHDHGQKEVTFWWD